MNVIAVAIDGEYKGQYQDKAQVIQIVRDNIDRGKVEVAKFEAGKGWVPLCLDRLAIAA